MKISEEGLELIRHFEGLRLTAYLCPAGVLTIGHGHTGKDVKPGIKIDIFDAEILLKNDCAKFEDSVNVLVEVPISQGQFDALVSFCYNLGAGALKGSTLLKLLNAGDYDAAGGQFIRWNKCNGRKLDGLTARREAEQELYFGVKKS